MANNWIYNDGGRANAGFNGHVGDCVTRAIAIATKQNYSLVWNYLNDRSIEAYNKTHSRPTNKPLADSGVWPYIYHPYLKQLGWSYTSVNKDMRLADLPTTGIVIVHTRSHLFCMIDGIIQDTYNSFQRARYVWGYFTLPIAKIVSVTRPNVDRYQMSYQYLTNLNTNENRTIKPMDYLYTVDQPNEHNTSLDYALEYWRNRAHTFTMLWGRERYQNPFSQISYKFADKLNSYYRLKLEAETELARLFALKPYVSPLMQHVSIFILINAIINQSIKELAAMESTQYTIKASSKRPITVVLPNRATNRVVIYKRVAILTITDMESSWGIRYGAIRMSAGKDAVTGKALPSVTRIVKSKMQINGEYSQWELL